MLEFFHVLFRSLVCIKKNNRPGQNPVEHHKEWILLQMLTQIFIDQGGAASGKI